MGHALRTFVLNVRIRDLNVMMCGLPVFLNDDMNPGFVEGMQ